MAIQWPDRTWGVRVQGVYKARKKNPNSLDKAVGDGRYGYRTRPAGRGVTEVLAFDGKELARSSRRSACRHRKSVCKLVTTEQQVGRDGLADFERFAQQEIGLQERKADGPRFRARKGQKPVR